MTLYGFTECKINERMNEGLFPNFHSTEREVNTVCVGGGATGFVQDP